MRAFVVDGPGLCGLRDDIEEGPLAPEEVRVQMAAAGICRTDISVISGTWPSRLPLIDGHEGAGTIVEVGSGVVDRQVGQRVVVGHPACGRCTACLRATPWFCAAKDDASARSRFRLADGTPLRAMVGKGTWAEQTVISADAAIVIPDEVPFEVAAVIGCAVGTGVGGVLTIARPDPGSIAIVFGGGGIGACTVMGLRLAGCTQIVVVEPSQAKHQALERVGATLAVSASDLAGIVAEVTDGHGFDVAFDTVGRPETIRGAWDATRHGGTVVMTGLGGADGRVEFDLNELSAHGKRLLGNFSGGLLPARDIPRYCDLYLGGLLPLDELISERVPFDRIDAAVAAFGTDARVLRQVIDFA